MLKSLRLLTILVFGIYRHKSVIYLINVLFKFAITENAINWKFYGSKTLYEYIIKYSQTDPCISVFLLFGGYGWRDFFWCPWIVLTNYTYVWELPIMKTFATLCLDRVQHQPFCSAFLLSSSPWVAMHPAMRENKRKEYVCIYYDFLSDETKPVRHQKWYLPIKNCISKSCSTLNIWASTRCFFKSYCFHLKITQIP